MPSEESTGVVRDRPVRVLVVEDVEVAAELLRTVLESAGYVVDTAIDGLAGLEKFRAGSWDLVITDRTMPRMNADELAAAIKQANPRIPIVLITGSGWAFARRELFDAVLDKPLKNEAVLACVEALLS